MYGISVRLLGGTPVAVPGVPHTGPGHAHDLDAMLAAITPRTRMILVCNPNNPTGAIVRLPEWQRFLAAVPPGVVVVSDEAYCEYVDDAAYPDTRKDLVRDQPLVLLRTFSKVHSLAGLRVGYAIAAPAMAALFDRVRVPYNVNALGQAAALAALDDPAHVERSRALARAGREWLPPRLAALGVTTFESHTNFLLADFGRDSRPVCAALAECGVLVRDMTGFGMAPAFARITIGTQNENERLIAALAPLLAPAPHTARSA
jgi:histidinol-phosphate aminotransferase